MTERKIKKRATRKAPAKSEKKQYLEVTTDLKRGGSAYFKAGTKFYGDDIQKMKKQLNKNHYKVGKE